MHSPGFLWQNRNAMNPTAERKVLIHNLVFNLLDGSFFGFGLGFTSFTTIIPLFVSNMTDSALLIGLIPAIHNVGWQFPQLLTAKSVSKMEEFKPFVLKMTLNERLPFLGFAIVSLLAAKIGNQAALALTFALLVWQGIGAGVTANAWQNFISKIMPSEILATFIGSQSAGANLLSSIGAILAGIILERIADPYNFTLCFTLTVICFAISWTFLLQSKEERRVIHPEPENSLPFWQNVGRILKQDKVFDGFLISRLLGQFGIMAFAFYTVFAVKKLGMDAITVGIMTSVLLITQTVANPLLGWLADRWSRKWILAIGSICAVLSALLAYLIKDPGWFASVFILTGFANVAYWTIGMAIALEFGNEREKPVYVGMSNTLIAPATILAPVVGGLLADLFGYESTFIISAICGVITFIIVAIIVKDKKEQAVTA